MPRGRPRRGRREVAPGQYVGDPRPTRWKLSRANIWSGCAMKNAPHDGRDVDCVSSRLRHGRPLCVGEPLARLPITRRGRGTGRRAPRSGQVPRHDAHSIGHQQLDNLDEGPH
jgi:hypothetical protein